jgi:hypothetical protein
VKHLGLVLSLALFSILLLLSCAGAPSPRTVSDVAKDLCVVTMGQRADVKAQAAHERVSPESIAKALCALNEIANPFLEAARRAGDEAVRSMRAKRGTSTCEDAAQHAADLGCPMPDAWHCDKLTVEQRTCIVKAVSCLNTRQCEGG